MIKSGAKREENSGIRQGFERLVLSSELGIRFVYDYFAQARRSYPQDSREYRMIEANTCTIEIMLEKAEKEKGKKRAGRLERARKLLGELFEIESSERQRALLEAVRKQTYSGSENPATTEKRCGTEITIDTAFSVLHGQGLVASQDEVLALVKERNYQLRKEDREGRIIEYVNGRDFLAMRESLKQSRQRLFL